ncbi:MAG: S24 family peptidase [Terriglobales bacterium]
MGYTIVQCYSFVLYFSMKFRALQENLRQTLWDRINSGEITGLLLAEQTGFKQAHISNFLNRKRGLSLEGMDNVLNVQHLSVLDLIDPSEVNQRASILPPSEDEFDNIVVTDPQTAASETRIASMHVNEILKFKKSFLNRLKEEMQGDRSGWDRFVIIKVDAQDGISMYPRLQPGATALLDRHYNSLNPYRKGETNMYAVRKNGTSTIRYVELSGGQIVLRPHNQTSPVEVLAMGDGINPTSCIIGRVCYVGNET